MILVTGGTGLVGSHLLYELAQHNTPIRAISRRNINESKQIVEHVFSYYTPQVQQLSQRIEWLQGDVTDVEFLDIAMKGVEQIYHAAAVVSFDPADKHKIHVINVDGTANMVNLAIENKVSKFCHVSSIAVFSNQLANKVVDEELPIARRLETGISMYAASKYKSEIEVWRGINEGLNAVIVNPSIIFGPGKWDEGSGTMFRTIWNGLKFFTTGITGYVDVRDVVAIMVRLMESQIINKRFILNSENCSYADIFSSIAHHLGCKAPKYKAAAWMTGLAYRLDYLKHLLTGKKRLITKEISQSAHRKTNYSNLKISQALNYSFIAIDDTIAHTARCFLLDLQNSKNMVS